VGTLRFDPLFLNALTLLPPHKAHLIHMTMATTATMDDLRAHCAEVQGTLTTFVAQKKMSLSTDKSNHDDLMGKENAAISQLTSKKEALATASQQDAKVRGTREKELSRAQKDVDSVAMFLEEKKAEHAPIKAKLAALRKQKAVLVAQAAELGSASSNGGGATSSLSLYQNRLGLNIETIRRDTCRFTFTQINKKDPSMQHSFVVFVDENRTYHISEIQPALEGVPEMVEQLNVDNGFDVFVREMRAKFREL